MEFIKILFVVTCLITTSSVVSSAPISGSKSSSDLEILVRTLLAPRVNLAIEKVRFYYIIKHRRNSKQASMFRNNRMIDVAFRFEIFVFLDCIDED